MFDKLCECGCGQKVKNRFVSGHNNPRLGQSKYPPLDDTPVYCNCGCGGLVKKSKYANKQYLYQHHHIGKKISKEQGKKIGDANRGSKSWNWKGGPEAKLDRLLKKLYKISKKEYDFLVVKQNSRCRICNRHFEDLGERLCVDHDHETGNVRGLLCRRCNIFLGNLETNLELINCALEYLDSDKRIVVTKKNDKSIITY